MNMRGGGYKVEDTRGIRCAIDVQFKVCTLAQTNLSCLMSPQAWLPAEVSFTSTGA